MHVGVEEASLVLISELCHRLDRRAQLSIPHPARQERLHHDELIAAFVVRPYSLWHAEPVVPT